MLPPLLLPLLASAVGAGGGLLSPPAHRVEITPTGGFAVDAEPFFPLGFYYMWQAIRGDHPGNGRPPRTDESTNASRWTADSFWQDYNKAGFNTFTVGWEGIEYGEGYGQMLEYLQGDLGTKIMPILNVGNTQEVYNSKPKGDVRAKADIAGQMAKAFSNSSILAYLLRDIKHNFNLKH